MKDQKNGQQGLFDGPWIVTVRSRGEDGKSRIAGRSTFETRDLAFEYMKARLQTEIALTIMRKR